MSKFSRWDRRLGTPNRRNAPIPRSSWLEDWEKAAIVAFHDRHPLDGYRPLAYMMLDADIMAVSPSSVYRVLKAAGKLSPRVGKSSRKGKDFERPLRRMSTGTSMFLTSTSAGRSSTSVASSTATAGSSSTGRSARA